MADTRTTLFILLVVIYFIFANDAGGQLRNGDIKASLNDAASETHRLLDLIGNATYGSIESAFQHIPEQNGTKVSLGGLEHIHRYNWRSLSKVQQRAREQINYALGDAGQALLDGTSNDLNPLLYSNVSGEAYGRWIRSKLFNNNDIPKTNFTEFSVEGPFGVIHHPRFDRNFTHTSGDVSINLHQKQLPSYIDDSLFLGNITPISAGLTLTEDGSEQEEWVALRGVHFPRLGHSVLTTVSTKFAGLLALPLFAPSLHTFQESRALVNETITKLLISHETGSSDAVSPWATHAENNERQPHVTPKCELIVFVQQIPSQSGTSPPPLFYDYELRFPTGAVISSAPKMHFSLLAFSPDCGFIIESEGPPDQSPQTADHLYGYKSEAERYRARHHMLLYGVITVLQLVSLLRQMKEASTPSTRSRVSFYSIAMMTFGDAFSSIIFIFIGILVEDIWVTVLCVAFFSFNGTMLFGMRFLHDIWLVYAPERRRQEQEAAAELRRRRDAAIAAARERQQRTYARPSQHADNATATSPAPAPDAVSQATNVTNTNDQSLPLPVTASQPVTAPQTIDFGSLPVFMPSDQAGLQPANPQTATPASRIPSFGSIYVRFFFLLIIALFISLSAMSYPGTLRLVYFSTLTFAYLSFWIPQIHRNAVRNCRRALQWEFVVSQSLLRLVPVAYYYGWEGSVPVTKSRPITLAVFAVWIWTQVVVLASQEIIGPRWFVKKDWLPAAWDYHPILRSDLEGSTLPLGLADSVSLPSSPALERNNPVSSTDGRRGSIARESKNNGKRVFDCAICMQDLEVPVVDAGEASEVNAAVSGSLMLARRTYMVTPCRHIFHSNCLEGWMKYRLQCPICREGLPPS